MCPLMLVQQKNIISQMKDGTSPPSLGFLLAAEWGGPGSCLEMRSATSQLQMYTGEEGETAAHTDT